MSTEERKLKVLVVDDAGEIVVLCVNMLQSLGYSVRGVHRSEAALDALRQEPFDLVIVDYRMPDLNGFELFERARPIQPEAVFMLLTGHGTVDVMEDATSLGFGAILFKPFTRQQLRAAVEQALQRPK